MTTKAGDWRTCRYLWQDMMRIEAASVGYDFAAGRKAGDDYMKACLAYEKAHGDKFDPYAKPDEAAA